MGNAPTGGVVGVTTEGVVGGLGVGGVVGATCGAFGLFLEFVELGLEFAAFRDHFEISSFPRFEVIG